MHEKTALIARGILPSTALHVIVLVWLALAAVHEVPTYRLYEIDLEPVKAAEPVKPAPAAAAAARVSESGEGSGSPAIVGESGGGGPTGTGRSPPGYVPPAAEAGRVLTAPRSAGGEPDALDFSVVQGAAARYAGGVTTSRGTSHKAVSDPNARDEGVAGVVGGTGTGAGPAVSPGVVQPRVATKRVDRSRPALPVVKSWSCAFPKEADLANVDFARVRIVVTVGIDGRARSVNALSDPGNGFLRAARVCAMGQRYVVALDPGGNPRTATTIPITVTFTR